MLLSEQVNCGISNLWLCIFIFQYYDTLDLDQKETTLRQDINHLVENFQSLDEDTNGDSEVCAGI